VIIAAADGSALGNPGPAGWAWYVDEGCWASGGWPRGTNNMGELMAVLDLLQQTAHLDEELRVYCDSTYVINTVTKWMAGWKRRGWRKGDGKPVMNVELIKALDAAMQGRDVDFVWVKGHSGHELNEAADKLANAAATAYRDGKAPSPGPGFADSVVAHPAATVGQVEPEPDLFSGQDVETPTGPSAAVAGIDLELVSLDLLDADTVRLGWRASTDPPAAVRSSLWVRSAGQWQRGTLPGCPPPS
jgi:ribonuclease HI